MMETEKTKNENPAPFMAVHSGMMIKPELAEHVLSQFHLRYIDLHRTTARERYDLLMQRCPGIAEHLDLQDIASFLRSTSGRFACKERHSPNYQQNSQRNHVC